MNFYRIRAFVDSAMEEHVCIGATAGEAMAAFSKIDAADTGEKFATYGIDVAMVHKITFNETGPEYEDVTEKIGNNWARASFEQCLHFLDQSVRGAVGDR